LTQSLITAESITKRYGNLVAVDDVGLSVSQGEIYALVGANGAGKSTLIRSIVGISVPDSGQVLICGENLAHQLPATKKHIGYLPEELIFYEQLTAGEYLRLVAGLKEDCNLSTGSTQGRRDVSCAGYESPSEARGLEVSAGGR